MTTFYERRPLPSAPDPVRPADLLRRRPQRITFTAHWRLHQRLQNRADEEGRSLSNLVAHLLEVATS